MAWLQVQKTAFTQLGAPGTISKSYAQNVTQGNLLLAVVVAYTGNAATPTDTLNSVWKPAGKAMTPNNGGNMFLFYAIAPSTGANTVHSVVSGSTNDISIAEYSGPTGSGVVLTQTIITQENSGTTPSASLFVANAGQLLIGLFGGSFNTFSSFVGLTLQESTSILGVWADNTSSAAGLNSASCTLSSSDYWGAKLFAFVPAGQSPASGLSFVRNTEDAAKDVGSPPVSPATTVFPGGNDAGNSIVLITNQYFGTQNEINGTITDTAGNTYTLIASYGITSAGNYVWCAIYLVSGCIGISSANTITIPFAGLADALESLAIELGGLATLDTAVAFTTAGTSSSTSYTLTAANAGEIIIAMFSQIGAPGISNTGSLTDLSYFFSSAFTEQVTAFLTPSIKGSNTISAAFTGSVSGKVGSVAVALIPTVSGGAGTPWYLDQNSQFDVPKRHRGF